jgi:solute carrier family 31 (copper transporter), member 1
MYWNWDTSIPYIFFKWWTAETPLGLGFAVLTVFFLAFLYETVINLRARYDASLMRQASKTMDGENKTPECCSSSAPSTKLAGCGDCCECPAPVNMRRHFTTTQSLIRSALFAFSNFYSLFLMMIFMTYNAYLCIALVFGAGTGHFWSSVFIPEADILNRPRSCCN